MLKREAESGVDRGLCGPKIEPMRNGWAWRLAGHQDHHSQARFAISSCSEVVCF